MFLYIFTIYIYFIQYYRNVHLFNISLLQVPFGTPFGKTVKSFTLGVYPFPSVSFLLIYYQPICSNVSRIIYERNNIGQRHWILISWVRQNGQENGKSEISISIFAIMKKNGLQTSYSVNHSTNGSLLPLEVTQIRMYKYCGCCSVATSCLTLYNPVGCSVPGSSVLHCLPKFAQIHLHWVNDAMQPSHPVSPSPTLNPSQHQGLSQRAGSLQQVAKVLEVYLQHQSFQWIFRVDFFRNVYFDLCAVQGTLKSLLQQHNSKASTLPLSAFFMVQLSHPYMTTGKTIALIIWIFVGKVMSLLFNMLSRLVITFLPRSKHVYFMAADTVWSDSGAQEMKIRHRFHFFPFHLPWSERTRSHDLCFFNVELQILHILYYLFI